jgi:hypothetical protein
MTKKPTNEHDLTPQQWHTLHALMDRIIPPDDFPGAWEAGVGDYLAGEFERDLQFQVAAYRLGLEALEAEATATMGKAFMALDASTQDTLLSRIEKGEVIGSWPIEPAKFFQMVIRHVMEGYYSDPGNGGNRDKVSWQMIGFDRRRTSTVSKSD